MVAFLVNPSSDSIHRLPRGGAAGQQGADRTQRGWDAHPSPMQGVPGPYTMSSVWQVGGASTQSALGNASEGGPRAPRERVRASWDGSPASVCNGGVAVRSAGAPGMSAADTLGEPDIWCRSYCSLLCPHRYTAWLSLAGRDPGDTGGPSRDFVLVHTETGPINVPAGGLPASWGLTANIDGSAMSFLDL